MRSLSLSLLLVVSLGCASSPPAAPAPADTAPAAPAFERSPRVPLTPSAAALAVVGAADRSPDDTALDAGRAPAELLTFLDVKPGMKVAELMAGGGYTVELLARAVGDTGVVYGENPKWVLEKFAEKPWAARLAKPVNQRVVRVDQELDAPVPADASGLDLVVSNLIYHDSVWLKADRNKMNAAVFAALAPGGTYVVIDHSAAPGHGVADVETLHRIAEDVVIAEVTAAGFVLHTQGQFLRNPEDDRDWNASPRTAAERRGTSDRFALLFRKPR